MENLNYFLFLEKKYSDILHNLIEINNTYEEITNLEHNNSTYLLRDINSKENYKKQIYEIYYCIQQIKIEKMNHCHHNFVDDEIDITPDKSKKIRYCSICEYTHHDFL